MKWVISGICAAAMLAGAPAHAEWREATSKHFVVYADASESEARETARRLELFDATLRYLNNTVEDPGRASNRVTIYVTSSADAVKALCGKGDWCRNVAGFYVPRVSGSVAFTPRSGANNGLDPQIVLFHEYTHHFLLGSYQAAYPGWFSEGFAEFASTITIGKDKVEIGRPAQHRAGSLYRGTRLSAQQLFAIGNPKMSQDERASLYARGWLLTHYLMFDPDRGQQLKTYLKLLNAGTPSPEAAKQAFGDLKALDRAVDVYLDRNSFRVGQLAMAKLGEASVSVRTLTPGEKALIALRMRSERGVNRTTAEPLYADASAIAARYPADAAAQGWLAEMAYDAGQDDAAEAAADRALVADPNSVQALLYKARVHLRRAEQAKAVDPKTWVEARSWIVRANKVSADDADILATFYRAFMMQHVPPMKSAVAGLKRAVELVPQDRSLRFTAAGQYLREKDLPSARAMLMPLAFDPHMPADNPAAKLVALIDSGKIDPAAVSVAERDSATNDD